MSDLCTCENIALGPEGFVSDEERLVRIAVSDRHVNKRGELKPSVIPLGQIETGLSVTRCDLLHEAALANETHRVAQAIEDADPKYGAQRPIGVLVARAADLRGCEQANKRAVCVIDDSIEENRAHALIVQTANQSEEDRREIRDLLLNQVFSGLVQVSAVYK